MHKLIVHLGFTLDGVTQEPARPDEDTRFGFKRGGWAAPNVDSVSMAIAAEGMAKKGGGLLIGRKTYEDFSNVWSAEIEISTKAGPKRNDGNPVTQRLNQSQKYIASTTLKEPLAWVNSTLLKRDAWSSVAAVKEERDGDLAILGNGILSQSLMKHNLIDEYHLSIYPLVLGSGSRLFPQESPYAALKLVRSTVFTTGVVIAVYQPADAK